MKVYLAGPIDSCTAEQTHDWRTKAKILLDNHECLDPTRRNANGALEGLDNKNEIIERIINPDLMDIKNCDAVIANCWKPSHGTSMEIYAAWSMNKRVCVIVPEWRGPSYWLVAHADLIAWSLDEACGWVKGGCRV